MSALYRTNNRYRVTIEYIRGRRSWQDARSRSLQLAITLFGEVGRCFSVRGPILSLPQAIMTNQVFLAREL